MNQYERTVIAKAKVWRATNDDSDAALLIAAVDRLINLEKSRDPQIREGLAWNLVVAGDELRSVKTGKFYPVTATIALSGGKTQLTVAGKLITRPTVEEPTATVRRGQDGAAVDAFVDVFSSGG